MILTDRPCGSMKRWMSHQRIPASTRIVRACGSKASTRFMPRMSRCRLPGLAVWPPMLKWPPPTETGRRVSRSACCSSASERGVAIAYTSIGFSWVTSLTVGMMDGLVCLFRDIDAQVVEAGQRIVAVAVASVGAGAQQHQEQPQRTDGRHQHGQQRVAGAAGVV